VTAIVTQYGNWLAQSAIPKLFISAEPGALITGRALEFCRSWPNQRETSVKGIHFIQEDAPEEIGTALASFLRELEVV
jgi:haloalkane dehalogenase